MPRAVSNAQLLAELKKLREEIGVQTETEKGPVGTGLVGRMLAVEQHNRKLMSLKNQGLGLLAGMLIVLGIVGLGVKGFLAALVGGGTSALH